MTTTSADKMPRYALMALDIEERIKSGALAPGSRLPSFGRMRIEYGASPATMERVYATLEKKGLIRREAKRGVFVLDRAATPCNAAIAVVWDYDDSRDYYYGQMLRGIQNAARVHGLRLVLLPDESAVGDCAVDGLIINGYGGDHGNPNYKRDFLERLPQDLPKVVVLSNGEGIPAVVSDDRSGILAAMRHLFALGHRRIAFLTAGDQWNADDMSRERLLAYREALAAAGIEPQSGWVRPMLTPAEAGTWSGFREQGRRKMAEWLGSGWAATGCTALLVQNDHAAIGAIDILQSRGYNVPGDISVVGFDGNIGADYYSPLLTTVKVPLRAIGERAVEVLAATITPPTADCQKADKGQTQLVLPTALRIGESSGPAAAVTGGAATGGVQDAGACIKTAHDKLSATAF
jgi:DNA-binding LacI/PurR family transcriptional regulator